MNKKTFFNTYLFLLFGFSIVLFLGSCVNQDGCTEITALNYDPAADQDDGSCLYELVTPTTYQFERGDSNVVIFEGGVGSSVFYELASVSHLLINDLDLIIEGLADVDGVSIEAANLLGYYNTSGFEQTITTRITGFSAFQNTFVEVSSAGSLVSGINNSFGAGDSILAWLDTIVVYSQDLSKLGTSGVYTTENGLDLKEIVHTALLGAVVYHNAVQQIIEAEDASSSSLVSGTNYTAQEHAWDLVMGYFGAARNYSLCSDEELASADFVAKDIVDEEGDFDGLLDWTSEYSFEFSRMAAERDLSAPDRDFTSQLFSLLLQGRTAITNKNIVETDLGFDLTFNVVADSLDLVLEQLVAANLIHFVNTTLQKMEKLGTVDEDIAGLNCEWASMLGFAQMLQYRNTLGDTPLTTDILEDMFTSIGDFPNYALAGSSEQLVYIEELTMVKKILRDTYEFSAIEVANW
ncbi:MAG: DUF4856 domain-containing protein [Chitinophagales bacterium]